MKDREIFEKETGIKLKQASGSGLLWQEYAEWQDEYIKWLERQIPQWISVKDILPDDRSIIDIMYLSGDIRNNVRWLKMFEQNNLCGTEAIEPVTHWRVHVIQPPNIKRGMEAEP